VRRNHRIVSVAVIVAVGVNTDGRREGLGMDIGPSEAETFWTEFLRKLRRRGLRGVKLVISDAHEGIKAAVAKLMNATWQRCRVHAMGNALAHAGKSSRRVVSAFMATAFAQDSAEAAKTRWRRVADQLRPKLPKLAGVMDEAEDDVLAYMSFPAEHWSNPVGNWDHALTVFSGAASAGFTAIGVLLGTAVQQVNVSNGQADARAAKQ
jgi:putative transposase